ncbi:MAG: hypothetical protein ACRDZ4_22030 [Egibacteraceae bacterium]
MVRLPCATCSSERGRAVLAGAIACSAPPRRTLPGWDEVEQGAQVSVQAWSVGVPGRPKRCAIARMAMSSRVDPEVICASVVGHGE